MPFWTRPGGQPGLKNTTERRRASVGMQSRKLDPRQPGQNAQPERERRAEDPNRQKLTPNTQDAEAPALGPDGEERGELRRHGSPDDPLRAAEIPTGRYADQSRHESRHAAQKPIARMTQRKQA